MSERSQGLAKRMQASLLLSRERDDDRLCLSDELMLAALDGSRPLSAEERSELQASPLTLARFAVLARGRRQEARPKNTRWEGSQGQLRAAAGGDSLELLSDDQFWRLSFFEQDGIWTLLLKLDPAAPFAQQALQSEIRVEAGRELLACGQIDADGELEVAWPFLDAPFDWLQTHGARFRIMPQEA
ncbi:hypothetical protein V8J88_15205 [Massilia sp. W12]|uniref:hypothetical protein n=1 Tax=Massilia sp. W12 TaxID=3126507 RepID=UPI0030D2F06B